MLYGLSVIDALLGAVYPSEAQRNLHGIHIAYDAGERFPGAVDAQPEPRHPVVILQIPGIKILAGMYVKQIGNFHMSGQVRALPQSYRNNDYLRNMSKKLFLILALLLSSIVSHAQYRPGSGLNPGNAAILLPPGQYATNSKAQSLYRAGTVCAGVGVGIMALSCGAMLVSLNSFFKELNSAIQKEPSGTRLSEQDCGNMMLFAEWGAIAGGAVLLTGVGLISAGAITTMKIDRRYGGARLAFAASPASLGVSLSF